MGSREIQDIPFEEILETNDPDIVRKFLQAFNIFIGQAIALKRFDILRKELSKRTANTDIVEIAMRQSPEMALLIGNYCGTLSLVKEFLTANEILEAGLRLRAVKIKKQVEPAKKIIQFLLDHPASTKPTVRANVDCDDKVFEHHFDILVTVKAIIQSGEGDTATYTASDIGRIYVVSEKENNSIYINEAAELIKEAAKDWGKTKESEDSEA